MSGGHLAETPVDKIYSGVVSLKGICILIFFSDLNGLDIWCTDIRKAYLEAKTKREVYIIAGSEFGYLKGHKLIIDRDLYGLYRSGVR